MPMAFFFDGAGITLLSPCGQSPVAHVILTGLVFLAWRSSSGVLRLAFFAWGEVCRLFPATCGNIPCPRCAAANAGLPCTARGSAALPVPLACVLAAASGWRAVFITASLLDSGAAFVALVVPKPMRRKMQAV